MQTFDAVALAKAAETARVHAYVPYSGFAVGAALLCLDGTIFTGCNVENAAFGAGICAERAALAAAASSGARQFVAIAVAGAAANVTRGPLPRCTPCGLCRQALFEFGGEGLAVVMALGEGRVEQTRLGVLLPMAFGPLNL